MWSLELFVSLTVTFRWTPFEEGYWDTQSRRTRNPIQHKCRAGGDSSLYIIGCGFVGSTSACPVKFNFSSKTWVKGLVQNT
ncbi:unnamed protein product [Calicophoron daubneyi]|uniref:Secreted protein n=1 Tax=Calicophoron daubneyi TaxID=300641 RepID=A0AAV2TU94_CALDB